MIKIEAIVREEKIEDVKEALQKLKVQGMTVSQVMGCGTQLGYSTNIRGRKVSVNMLPKIYIFFFIFNTRFYKFHHTSLIIFFIKALV